MLDVLSGKRAKRNADTTAESHELTALTGEGNDDGGDDNVQESEDGRSSLMGHNFNQEVSNFHQETTLQFVCNILVETVPSLLFSTIGLTFSGEVVLRVANWQAIKRVDELYILIPMLNNLKGNLEMNLSARLSTAANIGDLDDVVARRPLIMGNLSILQVQALIVSAIAAILSFILGIILSSGETNVTSRRNITRRNDGTVAVTGRQKSGFKEFMVLLTSSMASASISSVILGSFMCSLILICRRYSRDPDNITPPIASCLGDLLTLCIIGLVSAFLVRGIDTIWPTILLIGLIVCCGTFIYFSTQNEHARPLLSRGWVPLLGAMVISSGTGMVLDTFVTQFEGFGLLAIVIGGLPGAVGSVMISRLSTALHAAAALHQSENADNSRNILLMSTLFAITLPVLFMFLAFIQISGWVHLPLMFIIIFVPIFSMTVILSLIIARFLTQFLWSKNLDPDTYAMPIQSSLVDLVGQLMLVICFTIVRQLGASVQDDVK